MCTGYHKRTPHTQNDDAFYMSTDFIQFTLNFSCSVLCYVTILQNFVTYFSHVVFKDAQSPYYMKCFTFLLAKLSSGIEDANSDIFVYAHNIPLQFQCSVHTLRVKVWGRFQVRDRKSRLNSRTTLVELNRREILLLGKAGKRTTTTWAHTAHMWSISNDGGTLKIWHHNHHAVTLVLAVKQWHNTLRDSFFKTKRKTEHYIPDPL